MAIFMGKRSRLRFAEVAYVDGYEFFDLLELPEIPVQPDDEFYTVKAVDRIDLLAASKYGDPVLWWVLARANNLELLPVQLTEGMRIRIPSPRYVQQVLFTKTVQ